MANVTILGGQCISCIYTPSMKALCGAECFFVLVKLINMFIFPTLTPCEIEVCEGGGRVAGSVPLLPGNNTLPPLSLDSRGCCMAKRGKLQT